MQNMEEAIRERAYQLWVDSGFEHGNADAHWLAAQREILSASLGAMGRVAGSDTALALPKPKKARAPRKQRAA